MIKGERDYMEHLPGASVLGKLTGVIVYARLIRTVLHQIFQYGWIKGRMDPVTVCLVAGEPEKGCSSSPKARRFHGR